MSWLINKKKVAVHDGNFHPDDVFCVATLSILHNGNIKVIRTRDENIYSKADYVLDFGGEYNPKKNRFDHHQAGGAGLRANKISYSAFGLLWREYGEKVCGSKKIADILEKKLVEVVDADDCGFDLCTEVVPGLKPLTLTDVIYSIRPTWKEKDLSIDHFFLKAVDFAKATLLREIKIAGDLLEAESLVAEAYNNSKDKQIIIFDNGYLPKNLLCKYNEPIFTVYKERSGKNWRVTTIEKKEGSFEPRKNFPVAWWGKTDAEFAKVTGVEDTVFCRNGGVFAGARSKEGAMKLAELALQEAERNK
jgi:uncharacterized UPF0160 family protein